MGSGAPSFVACFGKNFQVKRKYGENSAVFPFKLKLYVETVHGRRGLSWLGIITLQNINIYVLLYDYSNPDVILVVIVFNLFPD